MIQEDHMVRTITISLYYCNNMLIYRGLKGILERHPHKPIMGSNLYRHKPVGVNMHVDTETNTNEDYHRF